MDIPCPLDCGAELHAREPYKRPSRFGWPTRRSMVRRAVYQHCVDRHSGLSTREMSLLCDDAADLAEGVNPVAVA